MFFLFISIAFIIFAKQFCTISMATVNSPTPKSLEKVTVGRGQT
nr:MAG TPA: hypothetical protein [Caudoviricetes sp.]